jgi:transcriptional regulator with XRE-family HTH domain
MTISERIYEIMKEKRQKQCAVAISAGYNAKAFNAMLKGRKKITAADIPNICKGLGVTPNELFGFDKTS